MTTETTNRIHDFERAGLGIAPFSFVGAYEDRGPKSVTTRDVTTLTVGAPGQPMGTCAYCGQGIAICCRIVDVNGQSFVVGSDFVRRTYAEGSRVRREVDSAVRKIQSTRRAAKAEAKRVAEPASAAQIKFARELAERAGVGGDFAALTKRDASRLIDSLR